MKMVSYPMEIAGRVLDIYRRFDDMIAPFQAATSMRCVESCSFCCRNWWVEATVVEVLPLAHEIYTRGQEEAVLSSIEEKEASGDRVCAILLPEPLPGTKGSCGYYEWRPLVCRLFGCTARRNRQGELEFCGCRIIREADPSSVRRAEMAIRGGLKLPVYQEAFMQVASLDPSRGYRRVHINRAIKEALEYLYWIRPRGKGWRKASGY